MRDPELMSRSRVSGRTLAHAILRAILGLNLFLHGMTRIVGGLGRFVDHLTELFTSTPLPPASVRLYAWVLPFLEAAIGALLATGWRTRNVLVAGSAMMATLVFGTALRSDWNTLAIQMFYVYLFYVLLAHEEDGAFSIDSLLERRRTARSSGASAKASSKDR